MKLSLDTAKLKKWGQTALGLALFFSPVWLARVAWQVEAPSKRAIVVVDYTVPFDNYQMHTPVHWLLDHAKVEAPNGTRWDPTRDYVGYRPSERDNPLRLEDALLAEADTLYLADAYGVYERDLLVANLESETPTLAYSPLVFGGVSEGDLGVLEEHLARGGDLVAEFNALAPPTPAAVSTALQAELGVAWSGWSARVFPDLTDTGDTPEWFYREFAEQFPEREVPTTPALVLVDRAGTLVVHEGRSLAEVVPVIRMTPAGRDRFGRIRANAPYFGWFALVDDPNALTYATLELPAGLTEDPVFAEHGLPVQTSAITERLVDTSNRLYLAFDASNLDEAPSSHRLRNIHMVQGLVNRRHDLWSSKPAFWQVYVPVMRAFLREPA